MSIAYLNGNYIPLAEAQVSVMDRGFLFGDGIYDFIPVYNGKLFRLEPHLTRLRNSLQGIELTLDTNNTEWETILTTLLNKNGGGNQSIYLQITRGPESIRNLAPPKQVQPTIFAFCTPLHQRGIDELAKGFTAITCEDNRWLNCNIKAITLLANVLLKQQAVKVGADESILIYQGNVTEGTNSNVLIVKDNIIMTPPLTSHILGGITRNLVVELCQQHNIPLKETAIDEYTLKNADEIWVTGSSKEIQPIIKLDDQPVGNGKAGPVWYNMITLYREYINSL